MDFKSTLSSNTFFLNQLQCTYISKHQIMQSTTSIPIHFWVIIAKVLPEIPDHFQRTCKL